MIYKFNGEINEKSIEEYKKILKSKLTEAIHLTHKDVLIGNKRPQPKNCHINAQSYSDENHDSECIRGWLVIDGGVASRFIILISHSVIKDSNGVIYEITPVNSLDPRPFLKSYLHEEDYVTLYEHLLQTTHYDRILIEK